MGIYDYDEQDFTNYDEYETSDNQRGITTLEKDELEAIKHFVENDETKPTDDIEECPDCQEKFADLEQLADHFAKHHDTSSTDDLKLPIEKTFNKTESEGETVQSRSLLLVEDPIDEEINVADPLDSSIKTHNLPLVKRAPTLKDGNCWYDAIFDQVVLHKIPGKPANHKRLRKAVSDVLLKLPQAKIWIPNIFRTKKNYKKFVSEHRKPGCWTDAQGIMCQATALFLERNIHIVGTANKERDRASPNWKEGGGLMSFLLYMLVIIRISIMRA